MKKYISLIIITAIFLSFSTYASANSGPTHWEGRPSSEILSIEQNTPITVENEDLVFDFSVNDNPNTADLYDDSYSLGGKVTASYQMHNPAEELQVVQMAFPFVGKLNNLAAQDILITSEGKPLPYATFAGDLIEKPRSFAGGEKKASFDFAKIISSITNEPYQAENWKESEKGKLYTITVWPKSDQGINYALEFDFDPEKTKIITWNFNRFERRDNKIRNASWCDGPTTLEVFVWGEDINFKEGAFTDGELSKKTDLYTAQTVRQELGLKAYLLKHIEASGHSGHSEFNDINDNKINDNDNKINDNDSASLSEMQLYNIYARALDKYLSQNVGYSSEHDIMGQQHYDRIFVLVYNVEFPPGSTKKVSVSYKTSGTMDMRETAKPMYTFDYILNPAKNWSKFKNLNIKIIPPEEAPYIVKSSIELNKGEGNIYTANLESLPDEDLYFALYEDPHITLLDKVAGRLYRSFGYLYPVALGAIIIIIGLIACVLVYKRLRAR
jgi:hypothetical protein